MPSPAAGRAAAQNVNLLTAQTPCASERTLCRPNPWGTLRALREVSSKLRVGNRLVGTAMHWRKVGVGLVALWCLAQTAHAQRPGDANCNNVLAADDVPFAAAQLFAPPPWPCLSLDGNYDGRLTAADVVAVTQQVAAPPASGPVISYLGLASADGTPFSPREVVQGVPVYQRPAGQGFKLVIEAKPGLNGVSVGQTVFQRDPLRAEVRPDLWVLVSAPLGDGSREVCDGGVPAVHPPDFRTLRSVTDAINDLGCHFAVATSPAFACTQDRFGRGAFAGDGTQVQFCLQVSRSLIFSDGETLVTVRVRDVAGTLGPLQQIRVRVGTGPFPASATPTATPTATGAVRSVSPTPSKSPTPRHSPTASVTPTGSPTRSPRPTAVPSASPTPTHTRRAEPSSTPSLSYTPTRPPSPSPSATPSTPGTSPSGTVAVSATPPSSASPTRTVPPPTFTSPSSPSATPSPSRSATPTRTLTPSSSPTRSPTRTTSASPTATRTPTAGRGPVITFFGLTRADDTLLQPSATSPDGIPIYVRPQGFGFNIVIEAGKGPSGAEVGQDTFVPSLNSMPDLQIVASRALGDGSEAVCDSSGGVPGVDPPVFVSTPDVIRAVNDFACRFVDGSGNPRGRGSADACTRVPPEQDFRFVMGAATSVQFCASVARPLEFPPGDTLLTARVLDRISADVPPGEGNPGPTARIIVRVGSAVSPSPSPSPTPTRSPSATVPSTTGSPSPSPTRTASRTPTSAPTSTPSAATQSPTRTRTPTPTGMRTPTIRPSPTASSTATPAPSGPVVTFFGVARADGLLVPAQEVSPEGILIFTRPVGAGFTLVIEGKPGSSGRPLGSSTYRSDLSGLPDLQIVASRALGDGSAEVCDLRPRVADGVPAVDPPLFDDVAAVNDLACRFRDGAGQSLGRTAADACVQFDNGSFGFVAPDSTLQFCALVDRAWSFPPGDTLLTVRLRDTSGNVGAPAQIVVRITS